MSNLELPLVFFTVLSQTAIGLVIISTLRQWAVDGPTGNIRGEWIAASALIIAGMVASFFHLGHPLEGYTALKHLDKAWLSREVLGVSIFLGLTVLGMFMARDRISGPVAFGAALVGLATILFMGMTYSPPSYPAINNVLPLVFFLITALLLGTSFGSWFASPEKRIWLTRVLTMTLIVGLVVYLIVPCVWLSGGTVMAQTGWAWIGSPLWPRFGAPSRKAALPIRRRCWWPKHRTGSGGSATTTQPNWPPSTTRYFAAISMMRAGRRASSHHKPSINR